MEDFLHLHLLLVILQLEVVQFPELKIVLQALLSRRVRVRAPLGEHRDGLLEGLDDLYGASSWVSDLLLPEVYNSLV